jgi:hypothetical protein
MTLSHHSEPFTANRVAAGALAALGAAGAIPIPLAQLDFAGLLDAFDIDSGDSPGALLVIAGVGGSSPSPSSRLRSRVQSSRSPEPPARTILVVAALAGLVTAMPLWIPAGVVIGAAAALLAETRAGAWPARVNVTTRAHEEA